jgi:hypothetical protein
MANFQSQEWRPQGRGGEGATLVSTEGLGHQEVALPPLC